VKATASKATQHSLNEVTLTGRLSGVATRSLPSGDAVTTFRVIIDRAPKDRGPSGRVLVDAIDCTAWRARVRASLARLADGDVVEVYGAIRRRFWKAGGQATSRVEVEVKRVRRAAA
jgi:single-strand DNA-binding protein